MVLRHRESKMTEQPVKKKLRRGDAEPADETDFIRNISEAVPTDLSSLHLTLPANVNEDDINSVNSYSDKFRTSDSESEKCEESVSSAASSSIGYISSSPYISNSENISMQPAPDIIVSSYPQHLIPFSNRLNRHVVVESVNRSVALYEQSDVEGLDDFQQQLIKQCLCGVSESSLRRPFEGSALINEWSNTKVLQFLSNLQLLFDVYLKQNNKGYICARIVSICDSIVRNEYSLVEQIISLCENRNKYINFLAASVLSSFLIIAKTNINNEWLESIINFLTLENSDYVKTNFALEVVRRVVEWKDIEIHVLEETRRQDSASGSNQEPNNCETVAYSDPESFDTSAIKGLIIKSLELKWPELIRKIESLIDNNSSVQGQNCILTFLALWERTISIKANLSVIDTKPFFAHLEIFVRKLNNNLAPIVWKQLLSLFNEVLCYGSTLALQDMLPDDTCQLAHLIVRYVKDFRLLDSLPYRREEGCTINSFVGAIASNGPSQSNIDKTLLQKMVLLVLKSVAITIKETRSDSSDSSIGSDDSDFYQDMQLIERSIRDVLKKVDVFIKHSLDFHPETPFSKVLVRLFSDQDDYMIEAMVCTLDITVGISYRNAVFPDLINMLNPIHSFIEFLQVVSHDSDVLLDYLVSNETCFLLYLLRILKYTKRNWAKFVSSCAEGSASMINELDDTMTVLIRLRMQINRLVTKGLFPYNISPVLRLLEMCENLYEGNEFS